MTAARLLIIELNSETLDEINQHCAVTSGLQCSLYSRLYGKVRAHALMFVFIVLVIKL